MTRMAGKTTCSEECVAQCSLKLLRRQHLAGKGSFVEGDKKQSEWGKLREKGEGGVFEKCEREVWREKSVMVAVRGRGEWSELALKLEKRLVDGK